MMGATAVSTRAPMSTVPTVGRALGPSATWSDHNNVLYNVNLSIWVFLRKKARLLSFRRTFRLRRGDRGTGRTWGIRVVIGIVITMRMIRYKVSLYFFLTLQDDTANRDPA